MGNNTHELNHVTIEGDPTYKPVLPYELIEVATVLVDNPDRRQLLDDIISGAIHETAGGQLAIGEAEHAKVFWHDHGSFVGLDGAMYNVRTDDNGESQVYVAPVDERGQGAKYIHPYTYDTYIGPHAIDVRVDFINGAHHAVPINSDYDAELQRREQCDVMTPRHSDGMAFSDDRDSIALTKYSDGHIEGWLHDGETGETTQLFAPEDIRAMIGVLDDRIRAHGTYEDAPDDAVRRLVIARQLGVQAVA